MSGDIVEDLAARLVGEHVAVLVGDEQLDVGTHGRQRGTQFVGGVGDELLLAFP